MTQLVHCDNCDYAWEYGGDLLKATCPSCSGKVSVDSAGKRERLQDIAVDYDLTIEDLQDILRRARHLTDDEQNLTE